MFRILVIGFFLCFFTFIIFHFRKQLYEFFDLTETKPIKNVKFQDDVNIILYYADWCSHCPTVKEWYVDLVKQSPKSNLHFKMVEEAEVSEETLKMLPGFPTILIYYSNGNVKQYTGNRSREDLLRYLDN